VATRPSIFLYEGNKGQGLELEQVQSGEITSIGTYFNLRKEETSIKR
jgi:hypothetical protein